jgi:hypothetical protein
MNPSADSTTPTALPPEVRDTLERAPSASDLLELAAAWPDEWVWIYVQRVLGCEQDASSSTPST